MFPGLLISRVCGRVNFPMTERAARLQICSCRSPCSAFRASCNLYTFAMKQKNKGLVRDEERKLVARVKSSGLKDPRGSVVRKRRGRGSQTPPGTIIRLFSLASDFYGIKTKHADPGLRTGAFTDTRHAEVRKTEILSSCSG